MARKDVSFEDVRIIYRNFAGKKTKFAPEGRRTFNIVLDEEKAKALSEEGWNVKIRAPRTVDESPMYYMEVLLKYDNYPPKIYKITSRNKTLLTEDLVKDLDNDEIVRADLIVSPYHWEVGEKRGIKGYVKTLYVTIAEDIFAERYRDREEPYTPPSFGDDD